jgi:7,8-dihydropterin-6-yl-methyl-4-(beta-D-ribofuranosyl)aminobenzene 5'-phosphate synthase
MPGLEHVAAADRSEPMSDPASVTRAEILVLVDNYADLLLPSGEGVVRPDLAREGEIHRDTLLAEHGLSLLLSVWQDGRCHRVLLDAGYSGKALLHNAELLSVDLGQVEAVVLSHGHMDHAGSLATALQRIPPYAAVVVHPDALLPRHLVRPDGAQVRFPQVLTRELLGAAGRRVVESTAPTSIADGTVLVTGPIPRKTDFEKPLRNAFIERNGRTEPDPIADDQALVVRVAGAGLVVITGCAHAGVVNTVRHAQQLTGDERVAAIIGGFHLAGPAAEPAVAPTLDALHELRPGLVCPMHCTGWDTAHRIRSALGESFVLSSVGTRLVIPPPVA